MLATPPSIVPDPWPARTFDFDFPVERLPVIVDRLRGAADRIEAKLRGLSRDVVMRRDGDAWSLQEHVGHFADLEALHLTRLVEIERGASALSPADLTNRATWDANYNARATADVLAAFRAARAKLVARLQGWAPTKLGSSALHPRLKQPMRVVDVAFFAAEHDDYYLAVMQGLVEKFGSTSTPAIPISSRWDTLPRDTPMALLERRRIIGEQAMISHITLRKGCDVPSHSHANEQFSCILSGKLRFTLADGERIVGPGEVIHLPSNAPHAAFAVEETIVLDIFAPPSATTGIDIKDAHGG